MKKLLMILSIVVCNFIANFSQAQPADSEIERRNPHGGMWCYDRTTGPFCYEDLWSARFNRQYDFDNGYTDDLNVYYFTGRAYCAEGRIRHGEVERGTRVQCSSSKIFAWYFILWGMRDSRNYLNEMLFRNLQFYYREYQRRPTSEVSDEELLEMERRL